MHVSFQEELDISDAIGYTEKGQPYAVKWPKLYKKVVPCPERVQTLQEAFRWPIKARENLDNLKSELPSDIKPVLMSSLQLSDGTVLRSRIHPMPAGDKFVGRTLDLSKA